MNVWFLPTDYVRREAEVFRWTKQNQDYEYNFFIISYVSLKWNLHQIKAIRRHGPAEIDLACHINHESNVSCEAADNWR